jgi:hypothetical protein
MPSTASSNRRKFEEGESIIKVYLRMTECFEIFYATDGLGKLRNVKEPLIEECNADMGE